ncbi:hypothetical protein Bca101_098831 [Brassica carinata]
MKGMFFLGKYLILVILVLGQLHGYKGCVEKERKALLEFVKYIISITIEEYSDYALPTWTYNTKSDCCRWEGVKCNRTSKRVTEIAFGTLSLKENSLLNLSLLHPFEDIRSLNLSRNNYYYNQFSGLFDDVEGYKTLRKLRKLEIMDLSRNRFNNSIFRFLNSAISLKTLFLGDNNFYGGSLPAKELKDLTNLELLDLSGNRFNGSIPIQELSALSKLKSLDLSRNKFSELSKLQGKLTGLQVLDLSSNQLNGNVPSALGSFPLDSLANLSELRLFKLSSRSNSFKVESGSFWRPKFQLSHISLPSCNLVKLSHNKLSGQVFPEFVNFTLLWELSMDNNMFTGKIGEGLRNSKYLQLLKISNNNLTGVIPSWIGKFPSLMALQVSNNSLEGEIPISLFYLPYLLLMDLSANILSGDIPPCVKSNDLTVLLLQDNHLSGEIPYTLLENLYDAYAVKNLNLLFGLDLSENELSGVIPESFSGLKNVESLDLSFNRLQGRIPQGLTELSSLAVFNVSFNNLSGVIPQGKQFNTFDAQSFVGNPLLCRKLTNRNCDGSTFQEPDNGVNDDESQIDMGSFYWSFLAAYVTILLGIFSSLPFDSPWSRFWFYVVDVFIHKVRNLMC